MAEVARDDVLGLGGEGAVEELVVVGVGAGVAGRGGVDAVGDGQQGADGLFEGFAVFGEFLALGDIAVFGFEGLGDGDFELAGEGLGDDLRLVAAGLPAGGDQDIRVEDNAHGKIVGG